MESPGARDHHLRVFASIRSASDRRCAQGVSKLVKNATLKIYPGGTHRLGDTSKEQLNADLLAFLKS
jgi:hypothetical protein